MIDKILLKDGQSLNIPRLIYVSPTHKPPPQCYWKAGAYSSDCLPTTGVQEPSKSFAFGNRFRNLRFGLLASSGGQKSTCKKVFRDTMIAMYEISPFEMFFY